MAEVAIGALILPVLGVAMVVAWIGVLGMALLVDDGRHPDMHEAWEPADALARTRAEHPSNGASTSENAAPTSVNEVSPVYLAWLARIEATETWRQLRAELMSEELVFEEDAG